MPSGGKRTAGTTSNLSEYLRRKGSLVAIEVHGDLESIGSEFNRKNIRAETPEEVRARLGELQERISKRFAEHARKTMSKWLSKDYWMNIGVTNQASENLFVKKVSVNDSNLTAVYYVVEGKYPANKFIRMGTRPHRAKWTKAYARSEATRQKAARARLKNPGMQLGDATYIEGGLVAKISAWARMRGFSPKEVNPRSGSAAPRLLSKKKLSFWKKDDRNIGPGQATQKNVAKASYRAWRSMVWAIYHNMMVNGISSMRKEQRGTKYFDYPKEYMFGATKGGGPARSQARAIFDKEDAFHEIDSIFAQYAKTKFAKSAKQFRGRVRLGS